MTTLLRRRRPAAGTPPERAPHRAVVALALLLPLFLAGCDATIPSDPDGTLEGVRGGTLRVGVAANPPWTELPAGVGEVDEVEPAGLEVELLKGFAEELDAEIHWEAGSEAELATMVGEGKLDVMIAGMDATSPWASHVALTFPYLTVPGPGGVQEEHVMGVPMGENAFMTELERYLLAQEVEL